MMKRFTLFGKMLILLGIIGFTQTVAHGQDQPAPPSGLHPVAGSASSAPPVAPGPPPVSSPPPLMPDAGSPPALQYVAPGVFEIGKCKITKAEGKVEFPASVNMKEGMLEYLLVGNTGKLHESLLRTDVEPYALQIALLLSGLEGSLSPLSAQGEDKLPEGDAVEIMVRWQDNGKEKKARIEEMVLQGKEAVGQVPWVFTGSVVREGIFAAQADKSIIAVFHDPVALIDHRLQGGNNDEIWSVNSQATPAVGTPMTVTITKKQAKANK